MNLFQLLDPRSIEFDAITARGVLAITTAVAQFKLSSKLTETVQAMTAIVTLLVGIATLISICFSLYVRWQKWKARKDESSSSSDVLKIVLFISLMHFAGCSLLPTEREQNQSLKATEALTAHHELTIKRALEREGVTVTKDGAVVSPPSREQVEITSRTSSDAGSKTNASGSFTSTIPMWVKIALLGGGLLLLVYVLKVGWANLKGTAIGQGLQLFDDAMAGQIRKLRSKAQTSTDPSEIARLNADIAELESERGRTIARGR